MSDVINSLSKIIYPLSELYVKVKLTKDQYTIIDAEDEARVIIFNWYAKYSSNGYYARRDTRINGKKKIIQLANFIKGFDPSSDPGFVIDHVNHDTLDNRKANLERVPIRQNNINRVKSTLNKTKITGVYHNKKKFRYVAFWSDEGSEPQSKRFTYGRKNKDNTKEKKKMKKLARNYRREMINNITDYREVLSRDKKRNISDTMNDPSYNNNIRVTEKYNRLYTNNTSTVSCLKYRKEKGCRKPAFTVHKIINGKHYYKTCTIGPGYFTHTEAFETATNYVRELEKMKNDMDFISKLQKNAPKIVDKKNETDDLSEFDLKMIHYYDKPIKTNKKTKKHENMMEEDSFIRKLQESDDRRRRKLEKKKEKKLKEMDEDEDLSDFDISMIEYYNRRHIINKRGERYGCDHQKNPSFTYESMGRNDIAKIDDRNFIEKI